MSGTLCVNTVDVADYLLDNNDFTVLNFQVLSGTCFLFQWLTSEIYTVFN